MHVHARKVSVRGDIPISMCTVSVHEMYSVTPRRRRGRGQRRTIRVYVCEKIRGARCEGGVEHLPPSLSSGNTGRGGARIRV